MSTTPPTAAAVAVALMPAVGALRRLVRRVAGPAFGNEVSSSRREVLLTVGLRPGSAVADVAHELGLAPNSVSTLVTQLVGAGLVVRVADPRDRRVGRLHLTAAAAAEADTTRGRRRALLLDVLGTLTATQVAELAAGIDAIGVLTERLHELEASS